MVLAFLSSLGIDAEANTARTRAIGPVRLARGNRGWRPGLRLASSVLASGPVRYPLRLPHRGH